MPIDTSLLPALERELEYAKHVSAGGQQPEPARIKAIEDQIQLVKNALRAKELLSTPQETADVKPPVETERADAPTPEKTVPPAVAKEKAA